MPSGDYHIYISKKAFDSLLEATFKESGNFDITPESQIFFTVEDLEEIAEGFATAFDERNKIKITA